VGTNGTKSYIIAAYFAGLGDVNASRPDNLPPSQGGKYQGFGSTPSPGPSSSGDSWGLSSRAAPSLSDFQENPGAALSKGWSLFSSVVANATRTVNESVIQPGMERVLDPEFQATVKGYASEASKRAAQAGTAANEWGKQSLGVDVAGQVGGVANQLGGTMGWSNQSTAGYGSLSQGPGHDGYSQYHDGEEDEDEFFGTFESSSNGGASSGAAASDTRGTSKKDDDWGEWKDF
jgi:ADP-ribosylation factor GTPase-activating protein 1